MTVLSILDKQPIFGYMQPEGIGPFVRRIRDDRGESQTALAERAGLTRSHMAQIESGKIAFPNADIRRRLAKALGVSHVQLLVAAGELADAEIEAAGVVGVIERDDDPAARAIADAVLGLAPLSDKERLTFELIVESVQSSRRGRR